MPSFEITAASTELQLGAENAGRASFTVTNTTSDVLRAKLRVVPLPEEAAQVESQAGWYGIEGEPLREFKVGAAEPVVVAVTAKDAAPGTYSFRLDAIGEERPDEDKARGQSVSFTVAEREEKKPFPVWIPILALVVLIGIGATVYLLTRGDDEPKPPGTQTPTVSVSPEPLPQPVPFTVEAETLLPAGGPDGGKVERQEDSCCPSVSWSEDAQAWFKATGPGQIMTLRFPVGITGYYRMSAVLTKAIDYGTIQLSIEGAEVGTFEGINNGVIAVTRSFDPGLALQEGTHVLRVTTVKGSAVADSAFAGIDNFTFTPTRRIRPVDIDRIKALTQDKEILVRP